MNYISAKDFAAKWGIAERTVRNYCAAGKIDGAFKVGKTWSLPADAHLPEQRRKQREWPLLTALREQMQHKIKGGIYHHVQIELTYNSNHIEGSKLTHDQTRYIFETRTIGITSQAVRVEDIIETVNHFRCIDHVIAHATDPLSEALIKQLHSLLKQGTADARLPWFEVGGYKRLPNEVGGMETTVPEDVHEQMKTLLTRYRSIKNPNFDDLLDFHQRFESIHPFQDGNGRVGRLVMFKECLRTGIVPFIIDDDLKMFYYRGLREWPRVKGYLRDTCLTAQDQFKAVLDYFRIAHS